MPVGLGIPAGTGEKGWIVIRYSVHSRDHASGIRHTGWYRGERLDRKQVQYSVHSIDHASGTRQ